MNAFAQPWFHGTRRPNWRFWGTFCALILLAGGMLWSLWPVLAGLVNRWENDPRYAHGYLVPLFSLWLLWSRRSMLRSGLSCPSAAGLLLLAVGGAVQIVGGYFLASTIEAVSIPLNLAGIALLLGGRSVLAWSWPAIAFLGFMIPLPWRVETVIDPPLQGMATTASTLLLRSLGFTASMEGNVIRMASGRIGVIEACSGLSMLITFVALATAMILAVKRSFWDNAVLLLSAVPVALTANVGRICFTGVLHETFGDEYAERFYHDIAGWLMIPSAFCLYGFVIWLFSLLWVESGDDAPQGGATPGEQARAGDEFRDQLREGARQEAPDAQFNRTRPVPGLLPEAEAEKSSIREDDAALASAEDGFSGGPLHLQHSGRTA